MKVFVFECRHWTSWRQTNTYSRPCYSTWNRCTDDERLWRYSALLTVSYSSISSTLSTEYGYCSKENALVVPLPVQHNPDSMQYALRKSDLIWACRISICCSCLVCRASCQYTRTSRHHLNQLITTSRSQRQSTFLLQRWRPIKMNMKS